ncbi:hypothetical protein [Maritalea sp.]|uniref:hypothetical protein n=1 Tax=Maritalea sp. TaxID=2003361 RepID=UPI003EF4A570
MTRFETILNHWPIPVATALCGAMIFTAAMEKIDLPDWLLDSFTQAPDVPETPKDVTPLPPAPDTRAGIPYAPAPGRDDRTPVPYISQVFELNDPTLPSKLSGIGPVFWDHSGQGTGTLIAPNLALTTAHLFVDDGKWHGPLGMTTKPPAPSGGRIYLAACGRAYDLKAIHLGSMAPRRRLGLDYAVVELATPACAEATVLPVVETPLDLTSAQDQILLSIGSYSFADLPRYASHPLYAARPTSDKFARYDVFGVRCAATGREDTGDVAAGSTAVIVTEGCDGIPGGSGGALLVSRNGGTSYAITGVTNSYRANTEYNNFTSIEGAVAADLAAFVDLIALPSASSAVHHPQTNTPVTGPWIALIPPANQEEDIQ